MRRDKLISFFVIFTAIILVIFPLTTFAKSSDSSNILSLKWNKVMIKETGTIRSIAYGNNTFVAVGDNGLIESSNDGINWTRRPTSLKYSISCVKYINNKFIAVGDCEAVLSSSDGENWTLKRYNEGSGAIIGVAWSGDVYSFAVGGTSFLTSKDLESWSTTQRQSAEGPLMGIVWGNNQFAAIEEMGKIYTSKDGIAWTMSPSKINFSINNFSYIDNRYYVLGSKSTIAVSDDLSNWSTVFSSGGSTALTDMTYDGGFYVATGIYGQVAYSKDGMLWVNTDTIPNFHMYAIGCGNGMFIAVGLEKIHNTDFCAIYYSSNSSQSGIADETDENQLSDNTKLASDSLWCI